MAYFKNNFKILKISQFLYWFLKEIFEFDVYLINTLYHLKKILSSKNIINLIFYTILANKDISANS